MDLHFLVKSFAIKSKGWLPMYRYFTLANEGAHLLWLSGESKPPG